MKKIIVLFSFCLILTVAFWACNSSSVDEPKNESAAEEASDLSTTEVEITEAETDTPGSEAATTDKSDDTQKEDTTDTDSITTSAVTTAPVTTEPETTAPSASGSIGGGSSGGASQGTNVGGGSSPSLPPVTENCDNGHDEVSHVAKAPTCKDIGWNAYLTCSRCDYTTYEEIAPLRWLSGSIPAFSLDSYRVAGQSALASGGTVKTPTVDGIASISEYSAYRELTPVGYPTDMPYNLEKDARISTTPIGTSGNLSPLTIEQIVDGERVRYMIAEDENSYYIAVQKISGATADYVVTRNRFFFDFALDVNDPSTAFSFDVIGQGRRDGWTASSGDDALIFNILDGYSLGNSTSVNIAESEYGDIVSAMMASVRVTDTPAVISDDYNDFNKKPELNHFNGWLKTSHLMTIEMALSKEKIREHLDIAENEPLPDTMFFGIGVRGEIAAATNYETATTDKSDIMYVIWNGALLDSYADRDAFGEAYISDLLVFGEELCVGCDFSSHTVSEKYRVAGEKNKYYHSCKNCGSFGATVFEAFDEKKETCTDDGHNAYISCERCEYTDKVVKTAIGHSYDSSGRCKNCGFSEWKLPNNVNTYYAYDVSANTPKIDGAIKAGEYGTVTRIAIPRAVYGDDVNTKWFAGAYDTTLASEYMDYYFAFDDENIYVAIYELGPELIDNGDEYNQNDVAFRNNHFFQFGFDLLDADSYLYFGGFTSNSIWTTLKYSKDGKLYTSNLKTSELICESIVTTTDKASGKLVAIGDLVSTNGIVNNPTGQWEVVVEFKLNKADILKVINEIYGTNYTELSDAMWIGMTANAFRAKTDNLNVTDNQRFRWLGNNDITGKQSDYAEYGLANSSQEYMLDVVVFGTRDTELHTADPDPCAGGHRIVSHAAKEPTENTIGWDKYETCENCSYSTYKELPMTGTVFKTGYARCIFTPTPPIGKFTSVHDDLYATCVAVNDGEKTLLLLSIDMKSMSINGNDNLKALISHGTGIPTENIFISVTHTHSVTPFGAEIVWTYNSYKKIANMVKEAIADLTESEMLAGTGKTTGMAWVRRYINSAGEMATVSPGALFSDPTTKSVSEADDTLQVIRFVREGKKDIVLMNWQGHLAHGEGQVANQISADMAQYLREDIESGDKDTLVAYFAGASGNLNLNAPNKTLVKYSDGKTANNHYEVVAHALAKVTLEVIDPSKMTKLETGEIKIVKEVYAALMKKDSPEAIAEAQARKDAGTNTKADDYLLARNKKESLDLRIAAISFGDFGLVTVPYEMFDNNGVQIKEASPFKMTFVLTNSDGDYAYMPSTEAWTTYGGYETEATYFANGTAESLVAQYIRLLNSLKNS